MAVERLDHPRLQFLFYRHGRARPRALHLRETLLPHRLRLLHRASLPNPLLARAPVQQEGLLGRARDRVCQHAHHRALHWLPAVLGQRPVVVVPRHRLPVAVVGAHAPPQVVQEVQLLDVGGAGRREPGDSVRLELCGVWGERKRDRFSELVSFPSFELLFTCFRWTRFADCEGRA